MIATFKALGRTQKILWSLGIVLAPLFIVSAVSPTPGMQKTARVYQTAEQLPVTPIEDNAQLAPEPQVPESNTQPVAEPAPLESTTQANPAPENSNTAMPSQGTNDDKLPPKTPATAPKAATLPCETKHKSCSAEDDKAACATTRSNQLSVFGIQLGVSLSDNGHSQDCLRLGF